MKRFFSNHFGWFLSGMLIIALISCSTPFQKQNAAQTKVDNINKEIANNQSQLVNKAKGYAYGSDFTLNLDPNPSKYTEIAKEFTSRTVAVLGTPNLEEVNQLKLIITNLLSNQKDLISKGKKLLEITDKEVYNLQDNIKELNTKLEVNEGKLRDVSQKNSELASKWVKLKTWIYWGIGIIAFIFISSIVGSALPAPWNSVVYIICFPFIFIIKGIFKLIPKVKDGVGVVGKEYKEALGNVVVSVQDIKEEAKIDGKEHPGIEKLKQNLASNLNDSEKRIVNRLKEEKGYL